tara:strand:+ start:339 stop:989 length:651 start_codon:yes stop_codon:yes gene_type:complete
MGELLKGIKRNLLNNKKNSFNIGFSNRSPFSYQLPSADPNSGVTPIDPPDMNDGTVERIKAQADATSSMLKTFSDVASTAIKEEKKKYSDQDIAAEKALRIQNRADKKNLKADKKEKRMTDSGGGTDKQKERLAKLRSKATDLETKSGNIVADINTGQYNDVSGADIERAQDEAAVAYATWKKNNPSKVDPNKNTKSNPCDDPGFKASVAGQAICS